MPLIHQLVCQQNPTPPPPFFRLNKPEPRGRPTKIGGEIREVPRRVEEVGHRGGRSWSSLKLRYSD